MKVLTVVGTRPQFVKAAPVSAALEAAGHTEILVHTGQHYDPAMSEVFFSELGLRPPDVNLGVGSARHGRQTGSMLVALEDALVERRPDAVVIYGDTNSTLAGALAACKLGLPLAHVEAGLRSFDRTMPEEHNRVVADHCADLLCCPTATAMRNLEREGLAGRARLVGDTMHDALLRFGEIAANRSKVLEALGLAPGGYTLVTLHRPSNVDDPARLRSIVEGLGALEGRIVWPVHPRSKARLEALGGGPEKNGSARLGLIGPASYMAMLVLERNAKLVVTDSGGVQKEAFFLGVPCITLRASTEWVETVASGWNVLAEGTRDGILSAVAEHAVRPPHPGRDAPGDGSAASRVVRELEGLCAGRP